MTCYLSVNLQDIHMHYHTQVESGMDVLRQVEQLGSPSGTPSAEVTIAKCGVLQPSEVEVFKADAAAQQMEAQIAALD